MPAADLSSDELRDLVSKFSHDVSSPLMCVIAISGLLARQAPADESLANDLKQIQAAAEEVAGMVRALGAAVAPHPRGVPGESS